MAYPELASAIVVGLEGSENFARAKKGFTQVQTAMTRLNRYTGMAQRTWSRFTGTMRRLGTTLFRYARYALLAATAMSMAFGVKSTHAFAQYEQALQNAITVTGLSGAAFDEAKERMFDFGLAVSRVSAKTPAEVAAAFYSLGSAGMSVAQQMKAAPGVIALAEATLADMGETTELVTSSMKAFGLGARDTNRIVNALAATIGSSRMNIGRLAAALPYAAATSHAFGISLEQTVAVLAKLVDQGLEASMAGTGFRAMLAQLATVSDEAGKALGKYGLGIRDVNVAVHGFLPVLNRLQKAGMSQADMFQIFGIRAANAATILTKTGAPAIKRFTQAITGTNRAFQMQERQLRTVGGRWSILLSTFQMFQIELVKKLGPSVMDFLDRLEKALGKVLKSEEFNTFKTAISGALGELLNKAASIVENKLPEWLEKGSKWMTKLADTEGDITSWGDATSKAFAKVTKEMIDGLKQIGSYATLIGILMTLAGGLGVVLAPETAPVSWPMFLMGSKLATGGLVGGMALNKLAEGVGGKGKGTAKRGGGKGAGALSPTELAKAFGAAGGAGERLGLLDFAQKAAIARYDEEVLAPFRAMESPTGRRVVTPGMKTRGRGNILDRYRAWGRRTGMKMYPNWIRILEGQHLGPSAAAPAWQRMLFGMPGGPTAAGPRTIVSIGPIQLEVNDESKIGDVAGRAIQQHYDQKRRAAAAPG